MGSCTQQKVFWYPHPIECRSSRVPYFPTSCKVCTLFCSKVCTLCCSKVCTLFCSKVCTLFCSKVCTLHSPNWAATQSCHAACKKIQVTSQALSHDCKLPYQEHAISDQVNVKRNVYIWKFCFSRSCVCSSQFEYTTSLTLMHHLLHHFMAPEPSKLHSAAFFTYR